ncbi:putative GTP-binding protein EngB [Talaromyces islandicus]|uniref:GTP-binding protein 8 n=1 Tax=Talaromyces islandicus TaxID=28573 RepID=A0A0U1LXF5_TALIS|nr:putative GTP-binding protein EngB [Talaromyces islandicus]
MFGRSLVCTACRASARGAVRLQPKRSHATKTPEPAGSFGKSVKRLTEINSVYAPKGFDDLESTDLAAYWDTIPPNAQDLAYADKVFKRSRHSPVKLFSAAKFRTIPFDSNEPEVAFIGRSNVGKSSIINALTESKICYTSKHPGKTTEMNAFGIGGTKGGESKIVLLDMPGYGKASRREWGIEIMKYLQQRKQLRRTYLLIDSLHGLKDTDKEILSLFRQYGISHQIILSKIDRILAPRLNKGIKEFTEKKREVRISKLNQLKKIMETMRPIVQPIGVSAGPGSLGEMLGCTTVAKLSPPSQNCLGISSIRWSILQATGLTGDIKSEEFKSPTLSSSEPHNDTTTPEFTFDK